MAAKTTATRLDRLERGLLSVQKSIAALAAETRRGFERVAKQFQETDRRTDERFRQTDERFRQTDERIERLVIAIGELIRHQNSSRK
jgi:hypothetical protein